MNFFTKIEGDIHTFAAWAEKELGKLSTEAPAIEKITDTILQYVGGAASVIAGIECGPAASKEVTSAVTAIQTGVTAVSGLVADFGATPTAATVTSALAANASALLAAAKITNPTSVKAANAIVTNLDALAGALTAVSTPAAPAA
jgi:O6-methylguanine-DNA--protein-cysteine methyltransferase